MGVASEIINELARNRDLKVIGRDSSFALGSQPATAQELGERLGARYLVEGTAQRSKNMLLVDVQLVDSRNGIIAGATASLRRQQIYRAFSDSSPPRSQRACASTYEARRGKGFSGVHRRI